jgi:hypothetical protein
MNYSERGTRLQWLRAFHRQVAAFRTGNPCTNHFPNFAVKLFVRTKFVRISLAVLVFLSSMFAVAPMAFCVMNPGTPSCCQKMAAHSTHCNHKPQKCPICSYSNVDAAPIHKTNASASSSPQILSLTAGAAICSPLFVYPPKAELRYFDSSPPQFVLNCVFRI